MTSAISRRTLLAGATLAISRAASAQSGQAHLAAGPGGRLKILITGGHPGDPEYGCGGTIARYIELGHEVTLLYLNRGEKGCSGKSEDACAAIRTAEAQEACRILKAKPRFANLVDGEAVVSAATYSSFRQLVEAEEPSVIFTHWPVDNHRDHRAISILSYDAWLPMKNSCSFYYYEVSDGEDTMMFAPTDYVDITRNEPLKRSACFAHASQSPDHFYSLQSEVSRFRGAQAGYKQAEAFIRHVQSTAHALPA